MLIDSHCHLNMLDISSFENGLDDVVSQAAAAGVDYMLCVGVDVEHHNDVLQCAIDYPNVFASFAVHPSDTQDELLTVDQIIEYASHKNIVAVGETGLDYYYENSQRDIQKESFRRHIAAARSLNLPLIVHTRSAQVDTIDILKSEGATECGAVMHCFTESWEMAKQALDLGLYISISGIVTFKNAAQVKEVASKVPLDRLLVETDAPYLTPVPYRGKPNYPAYVRQVAEFIALMRGISLEDLAHHTSANFFKLFSSAKPYS